MVEQSVVTAVQNYLTEVSKRFPVTFGALYGSQTTGKSNYWSDIDLIVVSKTFDRDYTYDDEADLWRIAGRTDIRIEPIACGEKRWQNEQVSPIILIAKREGQIIYPQVHESYELPKPSEPYKLLK